MRWETGLPVVSKLYFLELLHLREIVLMISLVLSSKVPGHLILIRMAPVKKLGNNDEDMEKSECLCAVGGNVK